MNASKKLILCPLHNAENSTYAARSLSSIVGPGHKAKKVKMLPTSNRSVPENKWHAPGHRSLSSLQISMSA